MYSDKKPKGAKNETPKTVSSNKSVYFTSTDGTIVIRTDGIDVDVDLVEERYE